MLAQRLCCHLADPGLEPYACMHDGWVRNKNVYEDDDQHATNLLWVRLCLTFPCGMQVDATAVTARVCGQMQSASGKISSQRSVNSAHGRRKTPRVNRGLFARIVDEALKCCKGVVEMGEVDESLVEDFVISCSGYEDESWTAAVQNISARPDETGASLARRNFYVECDYHRAVLVYDCPAVGDGCQ